MTARSYGDVFNTLGATRFDLRISGYTGFPADEAGRGGGAGAPPRRGDVGPELSTSSAGLT